MVWDETLPTLPRTTENLLEFSTYHRGRLQVLTVERMSKLRPPTKVKEKTLLYQ